MKQTNNQFFLIHYGELALKGKNRTYFEKKLADNISLIAKAAAVKVKVKRLWGRMVLTSNAFDKEKVASLLSSISGIVWFAPARLIPPSLATIKKTVVGLAKENHFESFAVRANVVAGSSSLTRKGLENKIGKFIKEKFGKRVDLNHPQKTFFIEITDKSRAFLFNRKYPGPGGLPVGSTGKALCLLSGGIDSPVAAYLIMNRGLAVDYIHFHSYPQTGKESLEKAKTIVRLLSSYQGKTKLYLIPFLAFQKKILFATNNRFLTLLYRRAMLKISETIAENEGYQALITGDSLGQVASQTIENLAIQNQATRLFLLRPLIGLDKEKIIEIGKKIGSYPISILPHQDCCSLFLSQKPATKARLEDIINEERKIDFDRLIKKCLEKKEILNL